MRNTDSLLNQLYFLIFGTQTIEKHGCMSKNIRINLSRARCTYDQKRLKNCIRQNCLTISEKKESDNWDMFTGHIPTSRILTMPTRRLRSYAIPGLVKKLRLCWGYFRCPQIFFLGNICNTRDINAGTSRLMGDRYQVLFRAITSMDAAH